MLDAFLVCAFAACHVGIVVIVYTVLCIISMIYSTLTYFPIRNIVILALFWSFVCLPLHTLGTIIGRSLRGNPNNPCRVASLPSPIPPAPFYARPKFIVLVSGLLPFGAIWSYKYYYVYGFLASVIIILITIQVCVAIVGTYILLNAENYHWKWTSFLGGASIGIYIFIYCVYFFFYKTEMNGMVQAAYFFAESVSVRVFL